MVRPADDTFATKTEAEVWLTRKEAELIEGDWIDPDAGTVLVPDYDSTWIESVPSCPSPRSTRWPMRSGPPTGRWFCWPPSLASGGPNCISKRCRRPRLPALTTSPDCAETAPCAHRCHLVSQA